MKMLTSFVGVFFVLSIVAGLHGENTSMMIALFAQAYFVNQMRKERT